MIANKLLQRLLQDDLHISWSDIRKGYVHWIKLLTLEQLALVYPFMDPDEFWRVIVLARNTEV